jgi:hypothetical protein
MHATFLSFMGVLYSVLHGIDLKGLTDGYTGPYKLLYIGIAVHKLTIHYVTITVSELLSIKGEISHLNY